VVEPGAMGSGQEKEVVEHFLMRVSAWDQELMAAISDHAARPYQSGSSDCFCMAMDCIEAVSGKRHYGDVTYSTDAGAAKQMRKKGFDKLGDAIAAVLPEREPGHIQRGDIAILPVDTGEALGVVVSGGIAWRSDTLKFLPMSAAIRFHAVD
jgi:hypothetical protein